SQKMEAVGRFAGGVADDFNNLLSVILSRSELILADLEPSGQLRSEVESIRNAGQRASALTRQLLALSRQQELSPRILDLNAHVRESEDLLRRALGADVELELRLDPHTSRVKADPGQLDQVIMNLVINARDAMPNGGKVILETKDVILDEPDKSEHFAVS